MGRHAGSIATLDARSITASTATAALRARRRHHTSADPSALFTPATGLRQEAFDELARWQDQQFTALQQAVEEAFTEAVHDLVRPYVDPERRGSTGSLPVVRDLATVPPPVVANPATEIDLDDQPTRQLARTSSSRRELRSRQKEREHARVVLARRLATGGALAAAAFGTVTFVGPKMLNGLGSGSAAQVSLADGPSASVAGAALALDAGKPAGASGGPAAAADARIPA